MRRQNARDSTASGRLKSARQRALVLHLKQPERDGFLECRARQLQSLVLLLVAMPGVGVRMGLYVEVRWEIGRCCEGS